MRTGVIGTLLASASLLAGCGGMDMSSDSEMPSGSGDSASGDAGFVRGMVPHHQSAIEMARFALDQAEHPQLRSMAQDIITAQQREIDELESIAGEIGVETGPGGDGGHMGTETDDAMGDPAELDGAQPFDRAFIDMMIPHHEKAIGMAQDLLETTKNPRLRTLAQDIVGAQQREIDQMRAWRADWY